MITLKQAIAHMDHASISDLLGDASILDLLAALEESHHLEGQAKADIIINTFGADVLLNDRQKRRVITLSLDGDNRNELANLLNAEPRELENISWSRRNREATFSFFQVEIADQEQEAPEEVLELSEVQPDFPLFPHQSEALYKCKMILEEADNSRVMLHMPTGSGKTRTAMHLITRHLNNRREGVVLWMAAGQELCEQAAKSFEDAWSNLGERTIALRRFWGSHGAWPIDFTDGILVAGLGKLWSAWQGWDPGEKARRAQNVSLIIFDEAHQSTAPTYKKMIEELLRRNSGIRLLGLSATPGRSHADESTESDSELVSLFGGKKVALEVEGYESPIQFLQDEGYLSRITLDEIENDSNLQASLGNEFDIPDSILEQLGKEVRRNLEIVIKTKDLIRDGHKRTIIFSPSVFNSNLLAALLKTQGISSESITSETSPERRQAALRDFRDDNNNEPMVLSNFGVLTTGFDAPKTSAVIIARPTTSVVLYSQMIGRGLRGPKVGGTDEAVISTVVDTSIPVFRETIKQFTNWDDQWKNMS
ncbi:MAG: DEAD/DEAH box helicase [Opitutales bacterium]